MFIGILATASLILMSIILIMESFEIEKVNDKLDEILKIVDKGKEE